MLPLNIWNSLTPRTRIRLANAVFECETTCSQLYRDVINEYHHNFNHDPTGQLLKQLLSHLHLQRDGTINITINITPQYADFGTNPTHTPLSYPDIASEP